MNQTAELAVPTEHVTEFFWGDSDAESTLSLLVAEIRQDATQAPDHYLRETIVPEGGE